MFSNIDFFLSLQGEEVPLIIIEGLNMFWKDTINHCIPHMMMTLKGRFKGKMIFGGIVFHFQIKPKVGYQQERGLVGYYIIGVIWRSRKGGSCFLVTTGENQALDIMTLCSGIIWSVFKSCELSYSPQEYPLYISV